MKFFNFESSETYHFTMWAIHTDMCDVDKMIAEAFGSVELDEHYAQYGDVSRAAARRLRHALMDLVHSEEGFTDWNPRGASAYDELIEDIPSDAGPEGYRGLDSLFVPMVASSIYHRIEFHRAAQALLIRAGKWNPDPSSSEPVDL